MSLLDALGGSPLDGSPLAGSPLGGSPLGGLGGAGGAPGAQECSRAGCRATAAWAIGWRNPKIHSPERVKVWVACDEHVAFLREFLAARDFPLAVAPVGTVPDAASLATPGATTL